MFKSRFKSEHFQKGRRSAVLSDPVLAGCTCPSNPALLIQLVGPVYFLLCAVMLWKHHKTLVADSKMHFSHVIFFLTSAELQDRSEIQIRQLLYLLAPHFSSPN